MDKYEILSCQNRNLFPERLDEIKVRTLFYLSEEEKEGRHLQYSKIFLSDAQNQYLQLIASPLYTDILRHKACSIIEQAPLDGSKISVLLKTSDADAPFIFQSYRLSKEDAACNNSYLELTIIFEKYLKTLKAKGLDMATHLVRTWIYVSDIDNNYNGVVKARNDVFKSYGLSTDTHFIASTGIGGNTETQNAFVGMDFLTYPHIKEEDKLYLKALDHLSPTHDYGVSFERGTRLELSDKYIYYISGTASIDKEGNTINIGNLSKQTDRLIENINALLKEGDATLDDVRYFIVYLRDVSDYLETEHYMKKHFPHIPYIIVNAKVCRPSWLIEMECIAEKAK